METEKPAETRELFPDPILSANVYCAGRLCEVISYVVAPLAARARVETDGTAYVWVMRYAKCGDHLKIRLHAPREKQELFRSVLETTQQAYFEKLGPADSTMQRRSRPFATAIDMEDEAPSDYPDRSFLWTGYRRSHVSFGYRPYLDDPFYLALLTRCFGRGAELLMVRLKILEGGSFLFQSQQNLLLRSVAAAISTLSLMPEDRALYLLYHRDSLLRHVRRQRLRDKGNTTATRSLEGLLRRFSDEAANLRARAEGLLRWMLDSWNGNAGAGYDGFEAWQQAVRELVGYVAPICGDEAYHIDPFAAKPIFPVLFKVLHSLSNQIGIDPLNEAFAHHLLLSLDGDGEMAQRPVCLRPIL